MADFADLISALPLYQELDRAAGRDGIAATDVAALKGLVTYVADEAGPVLRERYPHQWLLLEATEAHSSGGSGFSRASPSLRHARTGSPP